jgi:YidC/Oxa1 family membrane protein insertase
MQALQPKMKAIQERYKSDKQRQSEEMMKLYKETGTNPLSSCLPILAQSPFFFALYHVLSAIASGKTIGVIDQPLLDSARQAHIFGAPLAAKFMDSSAKVEALGASLTDVRVVTAVMIVMMSASQFFTQRQLMTKNVDLTVKTPYMQQQKMMMYVFPVIYIFFGINMPVGVLIYMVTSNLWTLGQQLVIIRQNPTPGSVAFKQRQDRLKAAGKLNADGTPVKAGLASLVKGGSAPVEEVPEDTAPVRRQQPKRQTKAQRQSGAAGAAGTAPADAVVEAAETTANSTPKVTTPSKQTSGNQASGNQVSGNQASGNKTPNQARGRAKTGGGGGAGGRTNQPGKRNPQPAGRPKKKS